TTASLYPATATKLAAVKADVDQYYLFGGLVALATNTRGAIATALAPAVGAHDLPDVFCAQSGCHDTDLATIHIDLANDQIGCTNCHGIAGGPIGDCMACHGETYQAAHEAMHPVIPAPDPVEACTQAGCHAAGVTVIHASCTSCHVEGADLVDATCGTCHEDTTALQHPAVPAHTVANTGGGCFDDLCHGTNVVTDMHGIDFSADGEFPGCTACHNETVEPSTVCLGACHSVGEFGTWHNDAAGHADLEASVEVESPGCVTCHGSALMDVAEGEHKGCSCHAYGHAAGATSCESCHNGTHAPHQTIPQHATMEAGFGANSQGCVACHGSNTMAVASRDTLGTADEADDEIIVPAVPAGGTIVGEHLAGCNCHIYGYPREGVLYDACEVCHAGPMDPEAEHPYHVGAHDAFEATVDGTDSKACVACHGTDLLGVGDVDFHVKDAHDGCVCHHYDTIDVGGSSLIGSTTTDATTCVSCHNESFAPHGFADGESPHHSESWVSASGHNTAELGTRGAYTRFDGSEGVLIRDSSGESIVATYPLPTQNVFWEADTTEAPAGAITGLDWDSVVTCEQCHTGLIDFEVDGPHGAQQIAGMGIDPNFSGEFENAALWAWSAPAADGTLNSTVTSVTPMAAKSGIIQYIPGGPTPTAPSAYALKTYLSAGETTVTVPGPAVVTDPDSVICAKCHDLHNPGTGHGAEGDGDTGDGYAHYHGHDYHDNPIEYAGLYQRSDDTTYTAFSALASTDTTLQAPAAGRGASGHCRNCHVAIPHGWSRPRLLVYETDRAPYNIGPSVDPMYSALEGRLYRDGVTPEGGQLKGISSTLGPVMNHEGEVGEYVNWQNGGKTTCQACGHHTSVPTPGSMWE
ncbi:MAG: hypothetical protein ACYCXR_05250, partial [Coriobacteriia bacterium]